MFLYIPNICLFKLHVQKRYIGNSVTIAVYLDFVLYHNYTYHCRSFICVYPYYSCLEVKLVMAIRSHISNIAINF